MDNVHFSSKTDLWPTPIDLFNALNQKYGFTLDPCATKNNAKCARFFTEEQNGLIHKWDGERVFMNPPYGRKIGQWVKKAYETNGLVVCLLPARTDTKWFHDYCLKGKIEFLKGRLKFGNSKNSAPFPSMLVIFESAYIDGGS